MPEWNDYTTLSSAQPDDALLILDVHDGTAAPAGTVKQVTVADLGLAPLASPAFTGTPTTPTAAALTDDTQVATTAYADAAVAVEKARAETAEALLAPLASPALTGTPTAPTATAGTSTTQVATTAFTAAAASAAQSAAEAASVPLSDFTALGDTLYGSAAGTVARLAGNTSTTRKFARQVGDGTASAAPAWDTLQSGDIPSAVRQRGFNVLIAPSNAPAAFLAAADVVLTGTADQTAINTALAALTSGGRALIAPGTVSLTDEIAVDNSYVELHGCGYATLVQAATGFSGTAAAVIHFGTAAVLEGNRLCDLQVDGNYGNVTAGGSADGVLASAVQFRASRVQVKNALGDGWHFQSYDGSTSLYEIYMEDCYSSQAAGRNVHIGTTVDNSEFIRVIAVGGSKLATPRGTDGIYVEGADCKFIVCHPYFNVDNGLTLAAGSANVQVIGGEYETNGGYGIQGLGADHVSVIGAEFYANGSGSLDLRTGTNLQVSVSDCAFHDVGATATGVITADASAYQLAINGNLFDCATGSTLTSLISLAVQGAAVTGNTLRSNNSAVDGVYLNGATYVKVTGNYLDGPVVEAGGADYNTVAHNGWNNALSPYLTLSGANTTAHDNLPAPGYPAPAASSPSFTSGTAEQLSTTQDVMLYVAVQTSASLAVAIGSTSAASTVIAPAKSYALGVITVRVPKGWYVKITGTVADLSITQVSC